MHRLILVAFGLSMLCAGCTTAPARAPVMPEPNSMLQSVECSELGRIDYDFPALKFDPKPYGWAQVRFDVERGVIVNVEVLDSSPKKLFDSETIAIFKRERFPSLASARGCVWSHKWIE